MSSSSPPPPPPCVIGEAPSVKAGGPEEVPPCILLNIPRPSSLKQDSDSEEDGSESCLLSESDSSRLSPGTSTDAEHVDSGGSHPIRRGVLSIDYLGQTFKGDLSPGGKIKSVETGMVFSNPSAWAIHCKKIVNPAKKSGCGWASVNIKVKKKQTDEQRIHSDTYTWEKTNSGSRIRTIIEKTYTDQSPK
ncbi:AGAP008858PAlike [Caligus rogercresseyi]|uniref:AGAP008858PAlike n=1 Tax=Caligus rogercresseyi TaxID=217165 RepID=A0A7T8GZ53_CALRO|nr:AGAP008858PAlike [Caligus rogercresseyi]